MFQRSEKYPSLPRRDAFTLLEILLVIGLIAALASMSLPVLVQAQRRSLGLKCITNLRQIGAASMAYASEHEMTLPLTSHERSSWTNTLQPYAGGPIVFRCPADENATRSYTYAINDFLTPNPAGAPALDFSRLSKLERPSATVLFAEASATYTNSDHFHFAEYYGGRVASADFASQVAVTRHLGAANYVFADGHLETLAWPVAKSLLAKPGVRFVDPTSN